MSQYSISPKVERFKINILRSSSQFSLQKTQTTSGLGKPKSLIYNCSAQFEISKWFLGKFSHCDSAFFDPVEGFTSVADGKQ